MTAVANRIEAEMTTILRAWCGTLPAETEQRLRAQGRWGSLFSQRKEFSAACGVLFTTPVDGKALAETIEDMAALAVVAQAMPIAGHHTQAAKQQMIATAKAACAGVAAAGGD